MYSKFAIFAAISLSLVTVGYSSFATNEACAAPREQGWDAGKCVLSSDEKYKYCCWHEADGDLVCQKCEVDGTNCDPSEVIHSEPLTGPGGGLEGSPDVTKGPKPGILDDDGEPTINDPPTTTEPKVPGDILPDDGEPTINDPQTTTEPKIKDPGKIEIPNLK